MACHSKTPADAGRFAGEARAACNLLLFDVRVCSQTGHLDRCVLLSVCRLPAVDFESRVSAHAKHRVGFHSDPLPSFEADLFRPHPPIGNARLAPITTRSPPKTFQGNKVPPSCMTNS